MPRGCADASLAWVIGSSRPLIVVDADREAVETLLSTAIPTTHVATSWSFDAGLRTDDHAIRLPPLVDPVDAFRYLRGLARPVVLSIGGLRALWADLAARRPLVDLLRDAMTTGTTIVALGTADDIPPDLREWTTTARATALTTDQRARHESAYRCWFDAVRLDGVDPLFRRTPPGASDAALLHDASRAAAEALLAGATRSAVRRTAPGVGARVWPVGAYHCEVGGLGRLKAWAASLRASLADDARLLNLQPELGVLVTGTPDSCPAVVAPLVARELQWPLVRLAGARDGAPHGDPATGCATWLAALEPRLPCVVLLDDLEALGLLGADGQLAPALDDVLAWVRQQERRAFVAAVVGDPWLATDALTLPGRFGRAFFLDLPGRADRDAILRVHLRAQRQSVDDLQLASIVEQTEGFTSGEIARAVAVSAGRLSLVEGALVDALAEEVSRTLPWSLTHRGEALRLRQVARGRFEPAN